MICANTAFAPAHAIGLPPKVEPCVPGVNTSSVFSLNNTAYDENDDTTVMEILDTNFVEDPLETITKREYIEFVEHKIDKNLSGFEKKVLNRYIQGESYVDIANKLNSPVKSIDNAIQRIRKKAIKCLESEE